MGVPEKGERIGLDKFWKGGMGETVKGCNSRPKSNSSND
jgi:hypothetical protein